MQIDDSLVNTVSVASDFAPTGRVLVMPPKLYMHEVSPPSRAVLITAAALGLDLELHVVDLMKGEHKTPEYLKVVLEIFQGMLFST